MGEICVFLCAYLYFLNYLMNMYCSCKGKQLGELQDIFNDFFSCPIVSVNRQ